MKKLVCLFLSLILAFSLTVPAFATDEEYPVIYLRGFGMALYSDDKESDETHEITPGVTENAAEPEFGTFERLWLSIIRFFTSLMNFFTKLINK